MSFERNLFIVCKIRAGEKDEEKTADHHHYYQHHGNYNSKHYPKPDMQSMEPLQPGTTAPHFALRSTPDQSVSLEDFRGRPVVLIFYPADFSPDAVMNWHYLMRYCQNLFDIMLSYLDYL
jgi:hypothetical protein